MLNSDWRDYRGTGRHEDRLDDPGWLRQFLKRWSISAAGIPAETLIHSLRTLRTLLRQIAEQAAANQRIRPGLVDSLNAYFDAAPVIRQLAYENKKPQLNLVPAGGKPESMLVRIAGDFAEALTKDDPPRIKICENKDCGWVFYDRSKNRSRKWCEPATCSNLMKVRRFRQRHRRKA